VFHGGVSMGIKNTNLSLCPDYMLLIQGSTKELTFGMHSNIICRKHQDIQVILKTRYVSGIHYRFADALILSYFLELDKYAFV